MQIYLYKENERSIVEKIIPAKEANPADWVKITQEEKDRLEAEWAAEEATETE